MARIKVWQLISSFKILYNILLTPLEYQTLFNTSSMGAKKKTVSHKEKEINPTC